MTTITLESLEQEDQKQRDEFERLREELRALAEQGDAFAVSDEALAALDDLAVSILAASAAETLPNVPFTRG